MELGELLWVLLGLGGGREGFLEYIVWGGAFLVYHSFFFGLRGAFFLCFLGGVFFSLS